jgi:beta-phosphoglucomutase-like phosphatase (HAD superfamily)
MIRPAAAVIFDCDGVLVDSEPLMNVVFSAMLNDVGLVITPEETLRRFMGRSMQSCVAMIEAELGRALPKDFLAEVDSRAFALFRDQLQPVAGIVDLLDALDHVSLPYAVASSGSHDKMRTTLGITGLLPRLQNRLTSATEVTHGKPAPDVFLLAATRLGAAPETCIVVEDSLLGIAAARAAGMQSIGYAAMLGDGAMRDAGATYVVRHLHEIAPLLALY